MGHEDPAVTRAAAVAAIGLGPQVTPDDLDTLARSVADPDPRVRAAAIAAFARSGAGTEALRAWYQLVRDAEAPVRRRAAEVAPHLVTRAAPDQLAGTLVELLDDRDATVIEAAAWALGELGAIGIDGAAVRALAHVATAHDDPLAREASVAALGALGDPRGLDAILAACKDKPAVRRRAVLALAPFEGDSVSAALAAALDDRDWQVRQAAEDLMSAERAEGGYGDEG